MFKSKLKQAALASQAEAVEAGLARLMLDPEPDDLDLAETETIGTSLDQMRSGESLDWREFSAAVRKKHSLP